MKKWWVAVAVVLCLGYGNLFPFEKTDAGELCIVETLLVEQQGGTTTLYSIDAQGTGETMAAALADMEDHAPGQLFLRQVKRIVFCGVTTQPPDLFDLPEDIPLGANVYISPQQGQELQQELERLEAQLYGKERRERSRTTLAQLRNQELSHE